MRRYIAELIESALHLLCAITNHARGCGLLNRSPLRRVYWWAINARWDDPTDAAHNACPLCRFDRSDYVTKADHESKVAGLETTVEQMETHPAYAMTVGCSSETWSYDARTGRMRRLA